MASFDFGMGGGGGFGSSIKQVAQMMGQTPAQQAAPNVLTPPKPGGGMETRYTPDGMPYDVPAVQNFGANPWGTMMGADAGRVNQGTSQGNKNIDSLGQQYNNVNQGYPAMQNSYGIGAPVGGSIPGNASAQGFGAKPITNNATDSASRGFNPWSLSGESNARGG